MKLKFVAIAIFALAAVHAQAQVSTNCTTIGNNTHCDSVDYGAQQQQAYQNGYQAGSAIGNGIAALIQRHQYNKIISQQCRQNGVGSKWGVIWPNGREDYGYCTAKQAGIKKK
jgi:hypothetical protein